MDSLELLFDIGSWSLGSFWLPLFIWTVIALPLLGIARLADSISANVRYRASRAILVALPLGLVTGSVIAFDAPAVREMTAVVSLPAIEAVAGSSSGAGVVWSVNHTAGAVLLLAAFLALWRLGLLLVATAHLRAYRLSITAKTPSWLQAKADEMRRELGIGRNVHVTVSKSTASPLTFGYRSPLVVLPESLVDAPDDLHLALLHELIHVRRHDYLLQWTEELLGALFFVHPLVALLRDDVSVLREITCDIDVLAHSDDRPRYARLLYQYASPARQSVDMAVGILIRENHLTKRIKSMKSLLDFSRLDTSKRTGIAVSVALLAVAMIAVACSDLLVHPTPATDEAPVMSSQSSDAFTVVEQMPQLVGGLASIQENLHYPESAKQSGVEGRVILQFVVDEKGRVVEPHVVRGLGSGLDEAAIKAVQSAQFKPGVQDGEPVKVRMSLPITFTLGGNVKSAERAAPPHEKPTRGKDGQFVVVDDMPELIGGLAAVQENLHYPQAARDAGVEGRVIVQFVVDESGEVVDPKIVRGIGSGLDEAALDAVRAIKFEPGTQDGKAVPVKMSLPITFALPAE